MSTEAKNRALAELRRAAHVKHYLDMNVGPATVSDVELGRFVELLLGHGNLTGDYGAYNGAYGLVADHKELQAAYDKATAERPANVIWHRSHHVMAGRDPDRWTRLGDVLEFRRRRIAIFAVTGEGEL